MVMHSRVVGTAFRASCWAAGWLVFVQTVTPCADVFFESCRCIATGDSFIHPLSSIVVVHHSRSAMCPRVQAETADTAPDVFDTLIVLR